MIMYVRYSSLCGILSLCVSIMHMKGPQLFYAIPVSSWYRYMYVYKISVSKQSAHVITVLGIAMDVSIHMHACICTVICEITYLIL